MYEAEKQEYQKMTSAIDKRTLLLDEKAIEIGKAINKVHRLIGEREEMIAAYEKETGLKYDRTFSVDIDKLMEMKKNHEDAINGLSIEPKKEEEVREESPAVMEKAEEREQKEAIKEEEPADEAVKESPTPRPIPGIPR